jgi:hypothetical protein
VFREAINLGKFRNQVKLRIFIKDSQKEACYKQINQTALKGFIYKPFQELSEPKSSKTTEIYTHLRNNDFIRVGNHLDQIFEGKRLVKPRVWIDDLVIYHSKIGQEATLSFMNKLYAIGRLKKKRIFIKMPFKIKY